LKEVVEYVAFIFRFDARTLLSSPLSAHPSRLLSPLLYSPVLPSPIFPPPPSPSPPLPSPPLPSFITVFFSLSLLVRIQVFV